MHALTYPLFCFVENFLLLIIEYIPEVVVLEGTYSVVPV